MSKVIKFPVQKRCDPEVLKLKEISDQLDEIILTHLTQGHVEVKDIAGLLSHRLGTLMRHLDDKSRIWDVCEKVLKKQAAID